MSKKVATVTTGVRGLGNQDCTVVVGAGHGGGNLVSLLRQYGYGGSVVMFGAEPHPPYHRPPLSKKFLSGDLEQPLRPVDFYHSQNIEMRLGTDVVSIDRKGQEIVASTGDAIGYQHLVLATGAEALQLRVPGAELNNVISLRTLEDAQGLRNLIGKADRLVIIGAGYVGLEVAAEAVANSDTNVVVLEREQRILARVASTAFSKVMEEQHARRGVEIRTSVEVVGFAGNDDGTVRAVQLSGGEELECDVVLVGVGAMPREKLAKDCGIRCDNGIIVDQSGRTNDPAIFAIGDVTKRPMMGVIDCIRMESIPSAVEQAKCVASTIAGRPLPHPEVPWFWSDQFDLQLKIAGIVPATGTTVVRGNADTGKFALFHVNGDDLVIAAETSNSPALFMAAKKAISQRANVHLGMLGDESVDIKRCIEFH